MLSLPRYVHDFLWIDIITTRGNCQTRQENRTILTKPEDPSPYWDEGKYKPNPILKIVTKPGAAD